MKILIVCNKINARTLHFTFYFIIIIHIHINFLDLFGIITAVRFGRVPKREKARILAAMQQSTQNRGHQRAMATELDDQPRLLAAVLRAHMETCEFTREKVTSMRQRARECPSYSMPTMVSHFNYCFFISISGFTSN